MSAADRFIAGEGELAALLRAQPVFDPPASLDERFKASVAAALREHEARAGMMFEAPDKMTAVFARTAAQVQAAQQLRRDAVLREVEQGGDAEQVLGDPVGANTWQWLRVRVQARAGKTAKPRRPRFAWWPALATVCTAALVSSVATHLYVQEHSGEERPALTAGGSASIEAAPSAPVGPSLALQEAPAELKHESNEPLRKAESAARPDTAARVAQRGELASDLSSAPPPTVEPAPVRESETRPESPEALAAAREESDSGTAERLRTARAGNSSAKNAAGGAPAAAPASAMPPAMSPRVPSGTRDVDIQREFTLSDDAARVAQTLDALPGNNVVRIRVQDPRAPTAEAWIRVFTATLRERTSARVQVEPHAGMQEGVVSVEVGPP